jgi:REP element-mobilizing transposase RayT
LKSVFSIIAASFLSLGSFSGYCYKIQRYGRANTILWVHKRRRKVIYGHLKVEIGQIIRKLCENKEKKIIKGKDCVDHIHMCEYPFS